MFHFILFLIATTYFLYRLITYRPKPPNSRFDWDALERDRQAGLSWDERQKKIEKNQYWTTAPKPKPVEHLPGVVDFGRYLKDKTELGIDYAERQRDFGGYMYYIVNAQPCVR